MTNLLELYVKLVGLVLVGFILGRKLPTTVPNRLGQILFWVGVPISIVAFLRQADLSGQIWIAPAQTQSGLSPDIAYLAILLGAFLAWLGIKEQAYFTNTIPQQSTQGSLILAVMVGNRTYALGVVLASYFGSSVRSFWQIARTILINPALWSFGFGLLLRQVTIPTVVKFYLEKFAWSTVALSLVLIEMRLSRLNSLHSLPQAGMSLVIKMLLVPLILGSTLPIFGVTGSAAQVVVLQMAMPPAFATLVIAETFNLDRDLAVTALATGAIVLLVTLPIWLWLF